MSRLNVAFVCQWYAPEPVSQPGWIVQSLSRRGAHVEVATGIPNYPTGCASSGYRAFSRRTEWVDGVRVHRTPLYPSHDSSAVKRLLNYTSWAMSTALLGQGPLRKSDVNLVYSSPATVAMPAMVARVLFGTPYVLLIQDVWPDSIFSADFLSGRSRRFANRLVSIFVAGTYRMAAQVVVTSPGMVGLLKARGVPAKKLSLAFNWVEEQEPSVTSQVRGLRTQLGLTGDDFVVMYAGNHGAAQGLDSVVRSFALLPQEARCHLVLVGDGVEKPKLQELASRECHVRVHFVAPQPRSTMAFVMAEADVQLVSLADRPLFAVTTPSKLQAVLAAGQPVLMSAAGDAAAIVHASGAGVAVRPGEPEELVAAVLQLKAMSAQQREELGLRGRDYYETHMSESVGAAKLMTILQSAARRSRRQPHGSPGMMCSG